MKAVGIKVLKNKLSEYVRLAESGETVFITDRDRIVAQLTPPNPQQSPMLADALLANAVREGWLTPPLAHAPAPPTKPNPTATLDTILASLNEDRRDR